MPRAFNNLTARTVQTAKPGKHLDGHGLYLVVDDYGKRWLLHYSWRGRRREMGLGPVAEVSLAEAREAATRARKLVRDGIDPIEDRKAKRAPVGATFGEVGHELVDSLRAGWKGDKTEAGWRRSIDSHAAEIKDKPAAEITTDDVLSVLRPMWEAKPEAAGKLRERIERILDSAVARKIRPEGPNPARWKGHLEHFLAKRAKLTRGHHAAVPYKDAPALMQKLAEREGMSARALEWTILTVARESMTLLATEAEVKGDLWTVPGERMKGGKEHEVPLAPQSLDVLARARPPGKRKPTDYLFPNTGAGRAGPRRAGGPMSNAAMDRMLAAVAPGFTVHGFRSTFRDWAGDCTDFPEEISDAAMAHAVKGKAKRAYRRGTALAKRRDLMLAWASYLYAWQSTPEGSQPE